MRLAAVTCLFGLRGLVLQAANYRRCAESLARQGIELWTVEGLLPGQCQRADGPRVITAELQDLLWHKERLLQLGVEQLPDKYDAVLWVDADVLFDQPDLREMIEQGLGWYPILQPYAETRFLDEAGRPQNGPIEASDPQRPDLAAWFGAVPRYFDHGIAERNFFREPAAELVPGHTGLAWAARREWWHEVGLYQHHQGGGGDETLAQGCWGQADRATRRLYSWAQWPHVLAWIQRCYAHVRGQVGYVPGIVRHLWHGAIRARGYAERQTQMIRLGLDPERHLVTEPGRPLRWSAEAPAAIRGWLAEYLGASGVSAVSAASAAGTASGAALAPR